MTDTACSKALAAAGRVATALVGFVLVGLAWQVAYSARLLNRTLLPSPEAAFERAVELFTTGSIWPDLVGTMSTMATGFLWASFIGIVVGLTMGMSRHVFRGLEGVVEFFRSLPVTTLYPLFILIFGIGSRSRVAMVFVASVFVIILNVAYGVRRSPVERAQMARMFGASRWQVIRWVTLYGALPQTLVGLRIALSYSLIVAIVCEMFMGTRHGLGQRVFEAYNTYQIDELYALVLVVGVLGYGLNKIFALLEHRFLHWVPQ